MKKMLLIALLISGICLIGCQCGKKKPKETSIAPTGDKSPCAAAQISKTSYSYPISAEGGAIRLEKLIPEQININSPFEYRIDVTNLTEHQLTSVVVSDTVPDDLEFQSSIPDMQKTEGAVVWQLGTLEPKTTRTISAVVSAKNTGSLSSCANVSYDRPACAAINIVEPKLALTKVAPTTILACDRIPLRYIIQNTGTGAACGIAIEEKLPQGLQTAQGDNIITLNVASLSPGESQEFEMMVDATGPGTYSGKATASAMDLPAVESKVTETIVNKPVLTLESSSPENQYVGRPVAYEITVTNNGDGIAEDAVLTASVPDNVEFINATEGGDYTHSSPGKVTWNIGQLAPNSSKTVKMEFSSQQPGEVSSTITANAHCAETVSTSDQTSVTGIPAILLEVIDSPDPIELGQDVTYTIKVTNQGSAANSDIKISCMLEEGMEYVASGGPTEAEVKGNNINFQPLASLAPEEIAEWNVTVKATGAGDMRFKTTLTEAQLDRPVEETEATKFYE